MTTLEIIGLPQSNFVWTVRIACAEKGVEHLCTPVPPHAPPTSIHPLGKIPVLRHGQVTLFESRAICAYVDGTFAGKPLMPISAPEAAQAEQWISLVATDLEPIAIRRFLFGYMFPKTEDGAPDRPQIDAAWADLAPRLALLEARLADHEWIAGGDFTLADCYLIPVLHYLRSTPEGGARIGASPLLGSYLERAFVRESVTSTAPKFG